VIVNWYGTPVCRMGIADFKKESCGMHVRTGGENHMLRVLVQSIFTALLILSVRWYPMQEMLFWVAVVAVLCGFGTIVVALISWLRQTVRRGYRWIQTKSQSISRPGMAPIAEQRHLSHIP
jgi:hypothetical protein